MWLDLRNASSWDWNPAVRQTISVYVYVCMYDLFRHRIDSLSFISLCILGYNLYICHREMTFSFILLLKKCPGFCDLNLSRFSPLFRASSRKNITFLLLKPITFIIIRHFVVFTFGIIYLLVSLFVSDFTSSEKKNCLSRNTTFKIIWQFVCFLCFLGGFYVI